MAFTKAFGGEMRPPVSPRALALLGRADSLLSESIGAGDAAERFLCCYLAALRGAGAVLAVVPDAGGRRPKSRSAWFLLAKTQTEFAQWAEYFAGFSSLRIAVEAGASSTIDDDSADEFYRQVGRFLHVVEEFVGADSRLDRISSVPSALTA